MLEPLYTADEMRAAEAGHDVEQLMARAGRAVAEEAMRRFPQARRFVAVCGSGANGGDGRIAVDVLRSAGRDAVVADDLAGADVIVDALFGTGFHGEPREDAARKIEAINAAGAPVVAVDLPSGVNASTGEVAGACVDATLSVTMHGRKVGLEVAPGRFHAGEVVVADIGLERRETELRLLTTALLELEPFERSAPTVLTPHEGELARLLGEESSWVAAHRVEAARRGAEKFGCVCLLKGADTLIAEPASGIWVCALGTPALATAGSGDVLTGVVSAFLAKGLGAGLAAAAAAAACQLASREIPPRGAVASDVIHALPAALN